MRSNNPVLKKAQEARLRGANRSDVMTIDGSVTKTFILGGILAACGGFSFMNYLQFQPFTGPFLIAGFILAIVISFKPNLAPTLAPIYSGVEGLALGCMSGYMDAALPGIVAQAVTLTVGTLFGMLIAYRTGIIKPTERFRSILVSATMGIAIFYLIQMVCNIFGVTLFSSMFGNGMVGIGFSLFVVGIAALNLILDFELITELSRSNAPKYMEWFGAFSLMVTLVWLYLEFLRLLAKLRSRE